MERVQAKVTKEAQEKTTQYGDRVVVDFETEWGEEASVWTDAGDDEATFARTLSEGQTITLLKKKGSNGPYYKFTDEQIASAQGQSSGGGGQPSGGQSSGSSTSGGRETVDSVEGAKEIANLTAAVYRRLDKKLGEMDLNNPPTSENLASMTSTIVIQAFD
jgi:hypothetical protein